MNSGVGLFLGFVLPFLVLVGISLLIWWLVRGLVLWYFRVNEIVDLLAQIERNTRSMPRETSIAVPAKVSAPASSSSNVSSKPASNSGLRCRDCGAELPRNADYCPKCLAHVRK